jgi:hypothetical protein
VLGCNDCSPQLGKGPTLVVSPLLALMRDQILAASRAGLRAAGCTVSLTAAIHCIERIPDTGLRQADSRIVSIRL